MIQQQNLFNLIGNKDVQIYLYVLFSTFEFLIVFISIYTKIFNFLQFSTKNIFNSKFLKKEKIRILKISVFTVILFLDNSIILFPFRNLRIFNLFLDAVPIVLNIKSYIYNTYEEKSNISILMLVLSISSFFLELHFYYFPFKKILYLVILIIDYLFLNFIFKNEN